MLDLVWENPFSSIDEEEWCLAYQLGRGGADGSHHGLELVEPAPTVGLELLLEGPCLEASQDLCTSVLGLAVTPGVCHRGVAYLRSKVSIVCFQKVARELRAIVGDDAVGDPKAAYEALDEFNC